jgi:hypothetical protein
MQSVSDVIPFTHAIEAARELADGAPFSSVSDLVGTELLIGFVYLCAGFALLRFMEWQGRRHATLERS